MSADQDSARLRAELEGLRAELEDLRALVERLRLRALADAAPGATTDTIAALSYELRTSLSAIMSLSELMARDPNLRADQQESLDLIFYGGERMLRLIGDALVGRGDGERPAPVLLPEDGAVDAPGSVLIIDDAPANLELLSRLLGQHGHAVRVASAGEDGLRAARESPPDLILLDVMLPRTSGFEICRQLKADPLTRELPVLFLSALSSTDDKLRGFAAGGDDYITKPFQIPEVLARVRTHLVRRRAVAALREGRARLEAILDNAPVGIALLGADWRPRLANRRWADLLGTSPEQARAISLPEASPPDDAEARRERLEALAAGKLQRYRDQARLLHHDGSSFWADLLVAPLPYGDGAAHFVAIITDITEQKQIEAELLSQRQALAAIRERERLVRELHLSLGRTLEALEAQARAAAALLDSAESQQNTLDIAGLARAARAAHADIREFLLGVGLLPAPPNTPNGQFGLRQSLARYLHEFGRLAGVQADLVASPDLGEIPLAPQVEAQLLRIVQEALTNARKHAAATRVEVALARADETLRLTVRDDGDGFLSPAPGGEGANSGLRAMRERAAAIGAELRIDSASGVGTSVSLRLPLRDGAPSTARTFLLVDDHQLFLAGLHSLLVARGVDVVGVAYDGEEALAQARALRPDIVLMDIEMPRMDGIEALRRIRAELPETRVVMLGNAVDDEQVPRAMRAGAAGFLLKRMHPDTFFALLAELELGEAPLAPGMTTRLLQELARDAEPSPEEAPAPTLSARQLEVLSLIARGLTYRQVAAELSLSVSAVRYHMDEIIKRLGVSSRAEAIAYAARLPTRSR